tara:strand:- start:229 stop:357 length:129 start_codon:yes stop_codon:yes gene_type:complete
VITDQTAIFFTGLRFFLGEERLMGEFSRMASPLLAVYCTAVA